MLGLPFLYLPSAEVVFNQDADCDDAEDAEVGDGHRCQGGKGCGQDDTWR